MDSECRNEEVNSFACSNIFFFTRTENGVKAENEAFVRKAADFSGRPKNLQISNAAEGKGEVYKQLLYYCVQNVVSSSQPQTLSLQRYTDRLIHSV